MRIAKLFFIALLSTSLAACSLLGKDGKGDGSADGYDSEGNLPFASADGVLKDITFEYDSASISADARETLSANADWLKDNKSATVSIEGHCDERGTAEYNLALGERRARSVFDYLRSSGVEASRMRTISYGEELPLDASGTESAWAKNRRVHFAVSQ